LIDEIYLFQNQFKESLVNAATDILDMDLLDIIKKWLNHLIYIGKEIILSH